MKNSNKNLTMLLAVAFVAESVIIWALGWVTYDAFELTIMPDIYRNMMFAIIGIAVSLTALFFYYQMKEKFEDKPPEQLILEATKQNVVEPTTVKKTAEELRLEEINRQFKELIETPEQEVQKKLSILNLDDKSKKIKIPSQITLDSPIIKEAEQKEIIREKQEEEKKHIEQLIAEAPQKAVDHKQNHLKIAILEKLAKDIEDGKIEIIPEEQVIDSTNIEKINFKLHHINKPVIETKSTETEEQQPSQDDELIPRQYRQRTSQQRPTPRREQISDPEPEPEIVETTTETTEQTETNTMEEEEPRRRGRGRQRHPRDEPLTSEELNDELTRHDEGL